MRHLTLACAALLSLIGCVGSGINQDFASPDRLTQGLVIILPGIEGESPWNHDIRSGLLDAGVQGALPIYRWGRPIPVAGPLINQMDILGNRLEGRRIAQMIVDFQDNHPGRPVYLVGHSGGGGVAVFAAESLPEGRFVQGLVLLSASISCDYDMQKALNHCESGIVNFYSPQDVGLLVIGTTLAGNVDGARGPASGQRGIQRPYEKVWQVEVINVVGDPHSASTRACFVKANVAPWVLGGQWPATPALQHAKVDADKR